MQIAIASTDGENVNSHFGLADTFYIYDQTELDISLLETRKVTPYSAGNQQHSFDEGKFNTTLAALSECSKIFCSKIGDKPKEELTKSGIDVIVYDGTIAELPLT